MFMNLNEEEFEIIIDSFKKNTFKEKEFVIK